MKIASIFSQGCSSNRGGYNGDSESHHNHEGSSRSYDRGYNSDRYEHRNEGGLLGIFED